MTIVRGKRISQERVILDENLQVLRMPLGFFCRAVHAVIDFEHLCLA